ncbi:hypothetical protein, partial [Stutzerimonas balearica]|uniref:hypothetical protein n=1 Tax=Stutzerimonas balearica TaxID=74829 RepID=UPI002896C8CD
APTGLQIPADRQVQALITVVVAAIEQVSVSALQHPASSLLSVERRQMPIFLSWLNETAGGSVTIARWPDAIMRDPCMRNRECYEIGKAPLRYSLPWVEQ